MESTIVIKVKYGETLRRFNARVVNGELKLGLDELREKVLELFNIAPNGDLTLTYIDEDGDVVTLVDEEDLRDVMRQSLNPLRITVRLNSGKGGRNYARSSGSSTPMLSPQVQHTIQNSNTGVSEILNSVQEPVHEAILKLSSNLASKTTSTAPGFSELVGSLSKMGFSYLSPVSEFQTGGKSSMQSGDYGKSIGESASKGPEASKVDGDTSVGLPSAKAVVPTLENNQVLPNTISKQPRLENNKTDLENTTRGVEATLTLAPGGLASVTPSTASLNLNGGLPGDNSMFESSASNHASGVFPLAAVRNCKEVKKLAECNSSGKSDALAFVNCTPAAIKAPAGKKNKEIKKSYDGLLRQKFVGCGASFGSYDFLKHSRADSQNTDLSGGASINCGSDWWNSSASYVGLNPINECPFSAMPLTNNSAVLPSQYADLLVPFGRSHNHEDGMDRIFHTGIRCDGCGVHPITGPRFKSLVKDDYDLCSICFAAMGNDANYIKIERPVTFRHPLQLKAQHSLLPPPTLRHVLRGGGLKSSCPRLESRFIQDVNVLDGTMMAPSTPFTKIWRMKNCGTIFWPQGTQLVWIGGDRLSDTETVEIEITADGLPVDEELDIAVDFTSPDLPGQYISYWRMASPCGQKFGQRVWVLIQVDASFKEPIHERFHGFNLNLPPVSHDITELEIGSPDVETKAEDNLPAPDNSQKVTEILEPIIDEHVSSTQDTGENNDVEQPLLGELEETGFMQGDLNKEISRENEYHLEQSVDDLFGFPNWDPILDELNEMGFCDKELNKRLLLKNNGSIKRVVIDLVRREKAII